MPDIEELKALVQEGQEKGYLTYDEVAAALEEIELTKEQLEDFYTYLLDHNIELLDAESTRRRRQHDAACTARRQPELDLTVEPSLDSLRLYLREIGKVAAARRPTRRSAWPSASSAATCAPSSR